MRENLVRFTDITFDKNLKYIIVKIFIKHQTN